MAVTVKIDDQQVRDAFTRLVNAGRNQTRALQAMGRYGKSSTQLRFRNEYGPDYRRWTPSERVKKSGGQTLRMSSRLRNSLAWQLTADGVEWGTNVVYAAAHQFGLDQQQHVRAHFRSLPRVKVGRKKGRRTTRTGAQISYRVGAHNRHMKLPARPFLGVNEVDRRYLLDILRQELLRQASDTVA